MTDKPDGKRGWWAIACATFALVLVTALSLCQTPTERAASRLRIGMTLPEVDQALSPEATHHFGHLYSWHSFTLAYPEGLRMTFRDDKLTDWRIGPPLKDDPELSRAIERRLAKDADR
jgi:hypothetical protein